jgi:branched-subunit amino acid ABC-type transport system permease component
MIGVIFIAVGLIMVGTGFWIYFAFNNSVQKANASFGLDLSQYILLPTIIMWVIGGLLILWGIITLLRSRARMDDLKLIAANGVDTTGIVTYLDRNYSVLVNNRPIYSIVEYRYQDQMGREFVQRANTLKTELIIRSGLQVGSPIKVRYLAADPAKSGIVGIEIPDAPKIYR